jgi:hypothetical protein
LVIKPKISAALSRLDQSCPQPAIQAQQATPRRHRERRPFRLYTHKTRSNLRSWTQVSVLISLPRASTLPTPSWTAPRHTANRPALSPLLSEKAGNYKTMPERSRLSDPAQRGDPQGSQTRKNRLHCEVSAGVWKPRKRRLRRGRSVGTVASRGAGGLVKNQHTNKCGRSRPRSRCLNSSLELSAHPRPVGWKSGIRNGLSSRRTPSAA